MQTPRRRSPDWPGPPTQSPSRECRWSVQRAVGIGRARTGGADVGRKTGQVLAGHDRPITARRLAGTADDEPAARYQSREPDDFQETHRGDAHGIDSRIAAYGGCIAYRVVRACEKAPSRRRDAAVSRCARAAAG